LIVPAAPSRSTTTKASDKAKRLAKIQEAMAALYRQGDRDTAVADYQQGYMFTSGPLAAQGKVVTASPAALIRTAADASSSRSTPRPAQR
jgi:hypothetical protein